MGGEEAAGIADYQAVTPAPGPGGVDTVDTVQRKNPKIVTLPAELSLWRGEA